MLAGGDGVTEGVLLGTGVGTFVMLTAAGLFGDTALAGFEAPRLLLSALGTANDAAAKFTVKTASSIVAMKATDSLIFLFIFSPPNIWSPIYFRKPVKKAEIVVPKAKKRLN
jgi:hypothetical protein